MECAVSIDLEKVAKEWSRKRKEEASRTAGFWGGFAIPTVGGGYGKKKLVSPFQGQHFKKVSDLTRHAQPGDLLMVSHGAKPFDARKAFFSLGTGLPHGYHAAVVADVVKQKGEVEILDLTIRGYKRKTIRADTLNNYSLFRIEDPRKRRLVVDNMQRLVNTQRGLNLALARHGMSKKAISKVNRAMYADTLNPVIGVRELFVPYVRDRGVHNANYLKRTEREFKFVASNIEGIAKDMADYWKKTGRVDTTHLKPMQRICTSIAAAVGVPVGRTSNPKWSGPNDLLRSGKLKPIGYKVSPKYNKFVGAYEALLKAAPNLIRGAAGVALGGFFAGSIAAKHVIKRKTEQRKVRQAKQRRLKRQIRVKGHMRKNKYVKSHTKTADVYERRTMDDLQDRGYERGLHKVAAIMELIKTARDVESAYASRRARRSDGTIDQAKYNRALGIAAPKSSAPRGATSGWGPLHPLIGGMSTSAGSDQFKNQQRRNKQQNTWGMFRSIAKASTEKPWLRGQGLQSEITRAKKWMKANPNTPIVNPSTGKAVDPAIIKQLKGGDFSGIKRPAPVPKGPDLSAAARKSILDTEKQFKPNAAGVGLTAVQAIKQKRSLHSVAPPSSVGVAAVKPPRSVGGVHQPTGSAFDAGSKVKPITSDIANIGRKIKPARHNPYTTTST
jgi:hypothetical protein